jgi:flagellar FliJ protein
MSNHRELGGEVIQKLPDLARMVLSNGLKQYRPSRASRATLGRRRQFQIDTARGRIVLIEAMIADFDRMANALESEIRVAQNRASIHDPGHFAYPTYAKATIARRDNLRRSIDKLKGQLDYAKEALAEALFEVEEANELRTIPPQTTPRPNLGSCAAT